MAGPLDATVNWRGSTKVAAHGARFRPGDRCSEPPASCPRQDRKATRRGRLLRGGAIGLRCCRRADPARGCRENRSRRRAGGEGGRGKARAHLRLRSSASGRRQLFRARVLSRSVSGLQIARGCAVPRLPAATRRTQVPPFQSRGTDQLAASRAPRDRSRGGRLRWAQAVDVTGRDRTVRDGRWRSTMPAS